MTLLAGCGSLVDDQVTVGGETHFLVTCQDACSAGLSCIDGVCTRGCEPGLSSCSELAASAMCVPEDGAGADFPGTCDAPCAADADCAPLGRAYTCESGSCRAEVPREATGTARQPLVLAVAAQTCTSGLRWVGNATPSAEMLPGSDCLGCHDDGSELPLMAAGTVFPTGGTQAAPEADGCFGVEGVEVLLIDARGRQHSTVTNRAGNFYFAGTRADLPLPYEAWLRWTLDGDEVDTLMLTTPEYGGCARCHTREQPPLAEPFDRLPAADQVIFAGPLFTPGLYPRQPPSESGSAR